MLLPTNRTCGFHVKTYSQYALKDVTGASSAAPTYFPPKYIQVLNETQAYSDTSYDTNT